MIKRVLICILVLVTSVTLVACDDEILEEPTTFVVSFVDEMGEEINPIIVQDGNSIDLPSLMKEDYYFLGWALTDTYNPVILDDSYTPESDVVLYAVWDMVDWSEVESFVSDFIPDVLIEDIELETSYKEYTIIWESSDQDILSNMGRYNRPYQTTSVSLTATIQIDQHTITRMYEMETNAYKSLEEPITSSYIYRDYYTVDDAFFESLDIINCAFITADSIGQLTGTSVLSNINTHIMPKAKEHGNWVLFSIAPDSEWSEIAYSAAKVDIFADNIVTMINEYGFDGVDIDWETPSPSEATRFTDMMEVIYSKVKANNPNHLVTAAIAGGMWQPPMYDLTNSHQYLDYINMMTYGMVSNNGYYQNALSKSTSFDSLDVLAGKTLSSCSIEESVEIYNSYGIPKSKIIVGVAFYGIKQTRTYNEATQTWSSWVKESSVSYSYIRNVYLESDEYRYHYDNAAGVPYITSVDGTVFVSYDNPRSIAEKSQYIIDMGLAGMMYWENGLDSTGTLLSAMVNGLKN